MGCCTHAALSNLDTKPSLFDYDADIYFHHVHTAVPFCASMDLRLSLRSGVALDLEFKERMFRGHIEADSAVAFQQRRGFDKTGVNFNLLHSTHGGSPVMFAEDQGLSFGITWRYCLVKMLQCVVSLYLIILVTFKEVNEI